MKVDPAIVNVPVRLVVLVFAAIYMVNYHVLATPLFGMAGLLLLFGVAGLTRAGHPGDALVLLAIAGAVLGASGSWLARRGVLDLPVMRARGTNLFATRDAAAVRGLQRFASDSAGARNALRGTVARITDGAVNAEVFSPIAQRLKRESPYKAIVSVLMLKEGWDVRNVTTIVGLRAYAAQSNILPEQTLGRGLNGTI